ncbi:MAG: hypothetical protein CW338_02335 [Clostridiales bacterium]|nr:hypothetical protein [Clostridiales bacterium]
MPADDRRTIREVSPVHDVLKGKKVIFFDVGNTLDRPASGNWMFTRRFLELAGERFRSCTRERVVQAWNEGLRYLADNHLIRDTGEECDRFVRYYTILSDRLDLGFTAENTLEIARDRAFNMDNYILYPDTKRVLTGLSGSFRMGIISDTWPSIEQQLTALGIRQFFSFTTYSFELGVFKPDPRMFEDALSRCGCPAEETVFIDDGPRNVEGAAKLGITPVLIAADGDPGEDVPYTKIRSLSELL